jgi:hypothetical protein
VMGSHGRGGIAAAIARKRNEQGSYAFYDPCPSLRLRNRAKRSALSGLDNRTNCMVQPGSRGPALLREHTGVILQRH